MRLARRLLGGGKPTNGVEDAPTSTDSNIEERRKYKIRIEHDPTGVFQYTAYISGPLGTKYVMAHTEEGVRKESKKWLDAFLSSKGTQEITGADL